MARSTETPDQIGHELWSSPDQQSYFSVADTTKVLPPDVYEPRLTQAGKPWFWRHNFSTEDLIRFDDSAIERVVKEIVEFWDRKDSFIEFGFPYRRGILLYGPPGSGKTCAVKLIINEVIKNNGIALRADDVGTFMTCMRNFRTIQPDTQVVAILEDLDDIIARQSESLILNLLDGIDSFENIVYLATTNYPEELENRIKNRPSRFDRRFEIGYPNAPSRKQYIEHLMKKVAKAKDIVDVGKWTEDTDRFTIAHIKELFISTVLFEMPYDEAVKSLRDMGKNVSSGDYTRRTGFMT